MSATSLRSAFFTLFPYRPSFSLFFYDERVACSSCMVVKLQERGTEQDPLVVFVADKWGLSPSTEFKRAHCLGGYFSGIIGKYRNP